MVAVNTTQAPTTASATPHLGTGHVLNTKTLSQALAATPGADAWQVEVIGDDEAQLYIIGERVESRRNVTNQRAHASVHHFHLPQHPQLDNGATEQGRQAEQSGINAQALGMSDLTLLASDVAHPATLAARLNEAVAMASLTDNRPFRLPGAIDTTYPMPLLVDPTLQRDMANALERARVQLAVAVAEQPGVRLSSAELYATRRQRSFRNSRGLTGSSQETEVALDLVLIAGEGDRAAEMHAELRRRRIEDLQIEKTVAAYATFARHAVYATTPTTMQGPVILSGDALSNFFVSPLFMGSALLFHASAQSAYLHLSRFALGESITGDEPLGDRLTLASDALRPYGVRSYRFDSDGLPATDATLIENGVFKRHWADARYSVYLDVPPTGGLGNITVGRGTASLDALRSVDGGPVYEIVSFSAFTPDQVTGDFASEIRLGYLHDASGVRPIKGGVLSGNVFTALRDVRFSAEAYTDGNYYGPSAARFGDLSVAGS